MMGEDKGEVDGDMGESEKRVTNTRERNKQPSSWAGFLRSYYAGRCWSGKPFILGLYL